jgi:hypothetical protein
MSDMIGPDGKPPVFDGAAWVSADGRYWWNGTDWQPHRKRGFRPPIALALIIVALLGGVWYLLHDVFPTPPTPYGVSNMKIDSSTEFEFDYRRKTACKDLTFEYVFFDQNGGQVDRIAGETHNTVRADAVTHVTVDSFTPLDSNAVRFTATPTCHD